MKYEELNANVFRIAAILWYSPLTATIDNGS